MTLVERAEEVQEGWLGSHGWQLKFQRDISAAEGVPLEKSGSTVIENFHNLVKEKTHKYRKLSESQAS